MKGLLSLFLSVFLLFSCSEKREENSLFAFHFNEKTLIINEEQDNSLEGTYFTVLDFDSIDLRLNLPADFFITPSNLNTWTIGWGNGKKYEDAGVENICEIKSIDLSKKSLVLGNLVRGRGKPSIGQRVVFLSKSSSGFVKESDEPLFDLQKWPSFAGSSVGFAGIQFDSISKQWLLLFQECDTIKKQIYAARSKDLTKWNRVNNGEAILNYKDFKNCSWAEANYLKRQTPDISDLQKIGKQWILVLTGTDKKGRKNIAFARSSTSPMGPFSIPSKALFSVDEYKSWNKLGNFSGKIAEQNGRYLLSFTGINVKGEENVGLAFSRDLIKWEVSSTNPVVKNHTGWRSKKESAECDYLKWKGDSIWMVISGTKQFKQDFFALYMSRTAFKGLSGNVDDAQLGVYLSTDGGKYFSAHKNNPVILNDYSDPSENEHMGGNIKFITTDTVDYFFYQAKTSRNGLKYSLYCRTKRK